MIINTEISEVVPLTCLPIGALFIIEDIDNSKLRNLTVANSNDSGVLIRGEKLADKEKDRWISIGPNYVISSQTQVRRIN